MERTYIPPIGDLIAKITLKDFQIPNSPPCKENRIVILLFQIAFHISNQVPGQFKTGFYPFFDNRR